MLGGRGLGIVVPEMRRTTPEKALAAIGLGRRCSLSRFAGRVRHLPLAGALRDPRHDRREVRWCTHLGSTSPASTSARLGRSGASLLGLGFVMFRGRDKGLLVGEKLEGLKRRIRAALERGAQAKPVHPHGQDVRQHHQSVACVVGLHDEPGLGADQQCR